jgi:hypothetical protein
MLGLNYFQVVICLIMIKVVETILHRHLRLPSVSAIYSGGVWMGGVDRAGSIKLSATAYQSNGFDFFAGPLDILGTTEATNCSQWDKIFTAKGNNILQHIQNYKEALENQTFLSCNNISDDILYWPAQGNPFFEEKIRMETTRSTFG